MLQLDTQAGRSAKSALYQFATCPANVGYRKFASSTMSQLWADSGYPSRPPLYLDSAFDFGFYFFEKLFPLEECHLSSSTCGKQTFVAICFNVGSADFSAVHAIRFNGNGRSLGDLWAFVANGRFENIVYFIDTHEKAWL